MNALKIPKVMISKSKMAQSFALLAGAALVSASALAKLPAPAPLDDAGKAKAAEAAAKTAWAGKVEGFQLCRSMEKVAAHTQKNGKTKEATTTPACADPGAFVYPLPAVAAVAAVAAAGAPAVVAAAGGKPAAATAAAAMPAKKP